MKIEEVFDICNDSQEIMHRCIVESKSRNYKSSALYLKGLWMSYSEWKRGDSDCRMLSRENIDHLNATDWEIIKIMKCHLCKKN